MGAGGIVLPPVPTGYITDGLVFFLDGKQLATASKWVDIVGGKVFNLTNCSVGTNGIVFDGTAYGICNGKISSDAANETIEIVATNIDTTSITSMTMFSPPVVSGSVGIGLRFGGGANDYVRFATILDGSSQPRQRVAPANITSNMKMSVESGTIVINGTSCGVSEQDGTYAANNSGNTYLGGRTTDGASVVNYATCIIHAVRIYNRKLTVAEMQANHIIDTSYYGV